MSILEHTNLPGAGESLASYVGRIRSSLGLSQKDLALKAGIHLQSLGKIERGLTKRLNQKTKSQLAYALEVPIEYLEAVALGVSVSATVALKFCPSCWTPGTSPDPLWTQLRANFCSLCGTQLRSQCVSCSEPITSLKFRFCPYCGTSFKAKS